MLNEVFVSGREIIFKLVEPDLNSGGAPGVSERKLGYIKGIENGRLLINLRKDFKFDSPEEDQQMKVANDYYEGHGFYKI